MSTVPYPNQLLEQLQQIAPHVSGRYAAQLLWQRGFQKPEQILGFLEPSQYSPTGPDAFGQEMEWAINRLEQARIDGETVTIWGDFDADGVTATAVLWEGLGQFFIPSHLKYWIPNRLVDSHGLNRSGLQQLHEQGTTLVITCDTGCTNLDEIEFANQLGLDVIVTDHHTLPEQRPPVVAIINSRLFPQEHPLASLSGVAVAYKVVEAWYQTSPEIPQQPLEELLDLVAIGLVADLVTLTQDCRYLTQKGLAKLQTRLHQESSRPGVAKLLTLCKKAGDRPTDISFGIGPRINAVSRIRGDARFCVELLTSRDVKRCEELAIETELANSRRKELQQRIKKEAIAEIQQLDLAMTEIIVIAKRQWPLGILGLVAGNIAQTWERPTILLQIETDAAGHDVARGSARSFGGIDLYDLIAEQSQLLTKFGGHPFAAGLSLPAENIELLTQVINQSLRLRPATGPKPESFDLVVTVEELGHSLFKELQLLEPYGMGNPVPRLLIKNCWFESVTHRNLRDRTGKSLKYIQALFQLCDNTSPQGFPGVWWEHYKDDIPQARCDVVAELAFNNHKRQSEVRVLDIFEKDSPLAKSSEDGIEILDYRNLDLSQIPDNALVIASCPLSWAEWREWGERSRSQQKPLLLAYKTTPKPDAVTTWQSLVGMTKAALSSGESVPRSKLKATLQLSDEGLNQGLKVIESLGIKLGTDETTAIHFSGQFPSTVTALGQVEKFLDRIEEERFQQRYFETIPTERLQSTLING